MSRACRSEDAQAAILLGVTIAVLVALGLGVLQVAGLVADRAALQAAADASALAAAQQASVQATLDVRQHWLSCRVPSDTGVRGARCRRGASETVRVTGSLTELDRLWSGLPGWARKAGCEAVSTAPVPAGAGSWRVCESFHVLAYRYVFTAAGAPLAAATAALKRNLAVLGPATTARITAFSAAVDGSGRVALHALARYPAGLVGALLGQPRLSLSVVAGAEPRGRVRP